MIDLEFEAYTQGRKAMAEGKENTDNPYSDIASEKLFDAWTDGYWDEHETMQQNKSECAA